MCSFFVTTGMVKGRHSHITIPDTTVHDFVLSHIGSYGEKICCIDASTEQSYTYNEMLDTSRKIASGLVKIGVKKGDVIAFYSPNSVDFIVMFYGCLAAGAIISPVNPSYKLHEVLYQLNDCNASYIYTTKSLLPTIMKAKQEYHKIKNIIVDGHYAGCVPFRRFLLDDGKAYPDNLVFNLAEDVCVLPYSSGTTGRPKGVMLTHQNIVTNVHQLSHPDHRDLLDPPDITEEERTVLGLTPFYHIYGMVIIMTAHVYGGRKIIVVPKFNPRQYLSTIAKYRISRINTSPPIMVFLAKSPMVDEYDLSSVKYIGCAAAPLLEETEIAVQKRLPSLIRTTQGYGMTECTTVAIGATKIGYVQGSIGKVIARTEAEIRDIDTGEVLGPNRRGELYVRGPQIMKGYLNMEEETRKVIDSQGFLRTGDIAYYTEDESFFIVDRIKELIKVKGLQVAPAELEGLLLGHPDVADSAVIGVPDSRAGEVPRAYVVRKTGSSVTEQQIQDYVKDLVSPHKCLAGGVRFINEIPKSPNGKILRRVLRAQQKTESKL